MSILDLIKEHEDKLLARITRLETQIKEIASEKDKLENKIEFQYKGLTDLLLGRIETPEGLEFHDGVIQRSFQDDLRMLVVFSIKKREQGQRSSDDEGRHVPYLPYEGRVHVLLDKAAGYPRVGSTITSSIEDAHIYVNKRIVWVQALLAELKKIM